MFNSTLNRVMAALGALSAITERRLIVQPDLPTRSRGKGQGGPNRLLALHRKIDLQQLGSSRRWDNPSDPVQAQRIAAAEAKRERKARKLTDGALRSHLNNTAHYSWPRNIVNGRFTIPCRLHPFYVNHGREA